MNKQYNDVVKAINKAGGPAKVGAALGTVAANLAEQRADLIASIVKIGQSVFTRVELNGVSTATLQRLVQQAGIAINSADSYVKPMPSPWPA